MVCNGPLLGGPRRGFGLLTLSVLRSALPKEDLFLHGAVQARYPRGSPFTPPPRRSPSPSRPAMHAG